MRSRTRTFFIMILLTVLFVWVGGISRLFWTQPPVEERVRQLQAMAAKFAWKR